MEKKKWLWKRKSSEQSPGVTESSRSTSSYSERFSDDQDLSKSTSTNDSAQSPEVTSKANEREEDCDGIIKSLTERLSTALLNVSAKDDLVRQHSKVAEEAIAGWEKAENEVMAMKKQLAAAMQQKSALEDRVSHLDGALKECVRQLRQAREEREEKICEAVTKKTQEWESAKSELENELLEVQMKANVLSQSPGKINPDLLHKLECIEQENESLKLELLSCSEELEVRMIERDLSTQAAETACKQHLDSMKKVAKLEAECRWLKTINGRSFASSIYVDSLTDSQSESGERLNAVDLDLSKMNSSDPSKCKQSKASNWNIQGAAVEINLMDDFLEVERLAALSETNMKTHDSDLGAVVKECDDVENSLRAELESMIHLAAELEEKLQKMGCEKVELEKQLEMVRAEKNELEMALDKSHYENDATLLQLKEAQLVLEQLHGKLSVAYDSKQQIESQIISLEAEALTMSEKVHSLEEEIEKERLLSAKITSKCEQLKEELSKTKQEAELQQTANSNNVPKLKEEDMAIAAGKLVECQKTIMSLRKQLQSLATLEDFLIDTNLPMLSANGSLRTSSLH